LAITRGATNSRNSSDFRCGATANAAFMAQSKRLAEEEAEDSMLGQRSAAKINVDVHIHIVTRSQDDTAGDISVRRLPLPRSPYSKFRASVA
jgi:hypothetical protein